MKEIEEIYKKSTLSKSLLNSSMAFFVGVITLIVGFVSLSKLDDIGVLFIAIGGLVIIGAVVYHLATYYLLYPDKWSTRRIKQFASRTFTFFF